MRERVKEEPASDTVCQLSRWNLIRSERHGEWRLVGREQFKGQPEH